MPDHDQMSLSKSTLYYYSDTKVQWETPCVDLDKATIWFGQEKPWRSRPCTTDRSHGMTVGNRTGSYIRHLFSFTS